MEQKDIRRLLEEVARGQVSVDEAVLRLKIWAMQSSTITGGCVRGLLR